MDNVNLNARERAALEEKKKDQKIRARFIIVGIIVVLLAALVIVVNSRIFTNTLAALKVSDGASTKNYSLADVNYEYQSAYMQIAQTYSSYGLLDTSKPLNEQECLFMSDGGTWDDYLKDQAESSLKEKTAIWKAAQAAGYTSLNEDELAQIDSMIASFSTFATSYGYQNVDQYLALNYGAGNNEKTIRDNMSRELLMNRYMQDLYNGYTYTDAELSGYYAEHENELNTVKYLYIQIPSGAGEGEDGEAAMAAAKTKAQSIVDKTSGDEEQFRAAVLEIAEAEPTDTSYSVSSFLDMYGADIAAEDVAEGACFIHEGSSGWFAVFVQDIEDNNYNTVVVRHILKVVLDSDGDGVYSDEEKQTAYDAVKAIEEEWLAGDHTEESFAALANEKSDDTGSNTNGGLYEGVHKGEMVEEFDAFCFGDRETGDTDIVYGESSSYAGYHLVYYVGANGENYRNVVAENRMRSDDYNEYYQSLLTPYSSERTFMWRYVMKAA